MNNIFYKIGLLAILAVVITGLAAGVLQSASAQNMSKLQQFNEKMAGNATSGNMTGGNATMGGNITNSTWANKSPIFLNIEVKETTSICSFQAGQYITSCKTDMLQF